MKVGDLIQTNDAIDIIGAPEEPSRGDIGFIKVVRDCDENLPSCEIYFPWIQKTFWLFQDEFEVLS